MIDLRERWAAGGETLGAWLSIPSSISAEATARQGFDYVCVDTQHGAVDGQAAITMVQAVLLADATPIARAPWNEPGSIGKLLDAGCHGVIVPMVNDREQAEAVVRACRYAPRGSRSYGPTLAGMRHADYPAWAADHVAVIPMIETVEALGNLDEILSTPGLDAAYVGPADLSVSLGLPPGNNDGTPAFDDALAAIVAACRRHGVAPGIHASGELAPRRLDQGFRMITVTNDVVAVRTATAAELAAARSRDPEPAPAADTGRDPLY